jgi:D-glutamate N-acetyltransferase
MKAAVRSQSERTNEAAAAGSVNLPQPYLLFLGDTVEPGYAKTAFGLRDWARDKCIGEFALPTATVSAGLPRLTPEQAHAQGARSLVIGVANSGGFIADSWVPALTEALAAGLDVISGMHSRLDDVPGLKASAERFGRRLIDVRQPPAGIPIATGIKRRGKRLLTVGTDCALGKKYTALALTRAFQARGVAADFRATGQTGIMIAGRGIAMDAVVSDFAAGAAEILSPDAPDDHWDVIEGQGSILHPAYAGVSLSLLNGSQPDVFVVCDDPARERMLGDEEFALPSTDEIIALTLALGARVNTAIRCGGVALNTSALSDSDADAIIERERRRLGLAVADPIRGGAAFEELVSSCLARS